MITKNTEKVFLLDAYALIYRAFFALNKNPRMTSKGLNTSAIIGFLNTLYEVLKNEKPSHIGIAFDLGAPTLRTENFCDYKANREEMPPDLRASIPYIIEIIKGFNIPIYAAEGYEADDVIGTLAKKAEKAGFLTYMMTPDKDFGQLVSDNIFIYKPAKFNDPATVMGPKEVCEKYGINTPTQLIDILGLWGDASDNIPGIPGVGEKTASKFVQEYGSLEGLLEHTDDLKGKMKENVINFAEQGRMSKMLATINTEAPVEFDAEELKLKQPNLPALLKIFEELEFRTFAKKFVADYGKNEIIDKKITDKRETETVKKAAKEAAPKELDLFSELSENQENSEFSLFSSKDSFSSVKHDYKYVSTEKELDDLLKMLEKAEVFACHFDWSGAEWRNPLITKASEKEDFSTSVEMTFAVKAHEAYSCHFERNVTKWSEVEKSSMNGNNQIITENKDFSIPLRSSRNDKLMLFEKIFNDPSKTIIGHNLKSVIAVLRKHGIELKNKLFDTMIAHYLIEPEQRHTMDYLADVYLNYTITNNSAENADIAFQLYEKFKPILVENQLVKLFDEIEMPLVPVLATMEANGVKIDSDNLKQISEQQALEIKDIENQIFEAAGTEFNIASPKQLGEVLFEKMKIKAPAKKTKTGQYPTGEEVLQKIITVHPIIQQILDYRGLTKLKSTYVDALPALISKEDGLVHTSYNQAVTATGRLSSTNPNLQNIPVRTDKGREIRKAFVPRDKNHILLAADYSQIELRIITHLSGDPAMSEAFREGLDIHAATAARVYKVPIEEVTKDMRRHAKAVNFGIIYGMSAFGLAERLGISRSEAASIIENYFKEYDGIQQYIKNNIEFARQHGYVETMLGRRRYLRDINASNSVVRNFAERNAVNAPIQGSSADMIKIAMSDIYKAMNDKQLQSKMILQVHDELVFDAVIDELDILKELVNDKMVNALPLNIPVVVELNTGENWLEAH
ncbi:MAG: DNA polymerase I [Bacteroidales bacterium]|nr:DNA polymerase I [Bacteroidales bacterium]